MDDLELLNRFTYHPPKTSADVELYQEVRNRTFELVQFVNDVCPDSREKSLSITHLEEAVFWANAAIARHGSEPPDQAG